MSSDEPNTPALRDRREAVREKALQVQAKQSRARTIRRISIATAIVVVVVVAAVAVTFAFTSAASKPLMRPANVQDDGFAVTTVTGVAGFDNPAPEATPSPTPTPTPSETVAGSPEPEPTEAGAVEIRVYVDYLSPGAKEFQLANVQQLSKWVTENAASLTYYPVAMLTAKSNGTKYSLRAAGAAACVATHAPDTFFAFNNALLDQQPEADTDGMTDDELADLAVASGVDDPKQIRTCIVDEDFSAWAQDATDRALDGLPDTDDVALTSAPMVLVNGTPYQGALDDATEFAQFVLTIASDAYYKTATPTPAPTATPTPTPTATP